MVTGGLGGARGGGHLVVRGGGQAPLCYTYVIIINSSSPYESSHQPAQRSIVHQKEIVVSVIQNGEFAPL